MNEVCFMAADTFMIEILAVCCSSLDSTIVNSNDYEHELSGSRGEFLNMW